MAQFCNREDMEDLYSQLGVSLRADDDDDGEVSLDEDRNVQRAIRYATTRIQFYLQVYDDMALEGSEWIREAATWMACYSHSRRRANAAQFKEEHDRYLDDLMMIKNGQAAVPDAVPCFDLGAPAMSNTIIDMWYYQRKQRVQGAISVGRSGGSEAPDYAFWGYASKGYPSQGARFEDPNRFTEDDDLRTTPEGDIRGIPGAYTCEPEGLVEPDDTAVITVAAGVGLAQSAYQNPTVRLSTLVIQGSAAAIGEDPEVS